jgi:hypothetical protein
MRFYRISLLTPLKICFAMITASAAAQPLLRIFSRGGDNNSLRGVCKCLLPSAKNHYYYYSLRQSYAMVHVLLTLNEPPLQRSAQVAPSVCPSTQNSTIPHKSNTQTNTREQKKPSHPSFVYLRICFRDNKITALGPDANCFKFGSILKIKTYFLCELGKRKG